MGKGLLTMMLQHITIHRPFFNYLGRMIRVGSELVVGVGVNLKTNTEGERDYDNMFEPTTIDHDVLLARS